MWPTQIGFELKRPLYEKVNKYGIQFKVYEPDFWPNLRIYAFLMVDFGVFKIRMITMC